MTKGYDNEDFLLRRLEAGDKWAMDFLYRQYSAALLKVSKRITGDTEQAKDITQEVFIALWEKRYHLKISKSVKSYLFRSVINRSLNFVRDHPATKSISIESLREELFATAANDASAKLEADELDSRIDRVIEKLPPQCKTIYLMNRKERMSYKEIAESLGITVKAVEKQVSKALMKIKESVVSYLKSLLLFSW